MPNEYGVRFIQAAMLSNLTGDASDAGLHTMSVDGKRVKLLGDFQQNLFDGKLFVREAGVQLRQCILDEHTKSGQLCFVATGTPGIGKSSFAAYFAAMLLREGKPVLYQLKEAYGILLEPSMAGQLPKASRYKNPRSNYEWLALLEDWKSGWYIVDSSPPLYSLLPTLLVTSTQPTMYKEWLKQAKMDPYFMPLPTDDEFLCFRDALDSNLADDQIFDRIGLVGRSFRKVFSNKTNDELGKEMDRILSALSALNIHEELVSPASDKLLTSSVVHITTKRSLDGKYSFDDPEYVISSERMRNKVVARAFQGDVTKVWAALQKSTSGYPSSIRASLFEEASRKVLVLPGFRVAVARWDLNGKLQQAQLMPSPFTDATLKPFRGGQLSNAGSFLFSDKVLFYPVQENFPVLDAFGTTGDGTTFYLLQLTTDVTTRRKLCGQGSKTQKTLDQAVNIAAEKGLRLRFVLVVPQGAAASALSPELPHGVDVGAEVWEIFPPL